MNRQIEAMVDRALSWARHHLDLFEAADSPDGRVQTALKPLVELSLLCMLHRRHAESHADARIGEMLAVSAATWKTRHGCDRLVRNPEAFRLHAIWHESLVHAGALGGEDRQVVQAVVDHGYVTATEDVGFRDLDLRHLLDLGGYRHHLPSYRALYRQTVLGRRGPVLSFNHADAYSVTHTLFYLSDFGARPVDAIPRRERPHVRWVLQTLLSRYLLLKDWDLVAELLLGAACVRWKLPDALCDAAWSGLIGAQRDDGAIPSRSFEDDAWTALPENERRAYAFEHSYHTTLAAAIAGFTVGRVPVRSCRARGWHGDAPVEAARSEEWRRVAEAAERWFVSLLRLDISIRHVLQILVGLWLTKHRGGRGADEQPDAAWAAAARRAAELLGADAGEILADGRAGIDTVLASLGCSDWIEPPADLELALASLRQNQLERGAVLLRASSSRCPAGDPSIAAGAALLMMQQRPDGAFGFLGPECRRISETRPDVRPELDVTLPITVAVVWCLAEVLTSDLRLYPAAAHGALGSPQSSADHDDRELERIRPGVRYDGERGFLDGLLRPIHSCEVS